MPVDLPKRVFTLDEYYRMAEAGIFEHERVELVNGEIIAMAPVGSMHSACLSRLTGELGRLIERAFILRVQSPLRLNERTELEPDLAVVRYRQDHYAGGHPRPEDTLLAIEVAESSLAYDRDVKMALYARAGIPEAWLLDVNGRNLAVYSAPSIGLYASTVRYGPGEVVSSSSVTGLTLEADDILP